MWVVSLLRYASESFRRARRLRTISEPVPRAHLLRAHEERPHRARHICGLLLAAQRIGRGIHDVIHCARTFAKRQIAGFKSGEAAVRCVIANQAPKRMRAAGRAHEIEGRPEETSELWCHCNDIAHVFAHVVRTIRPQVSIADDTELVILTPIKHANKAYIRHEGT
jgi:hypothetical protein